MICSCAWNCTLRWYLHGLVDFGWSDHLCGIVYLHDLIINKDFSCSFPIGRCSFVLVVFFIFPCALKNIMWHENVLQNLCFKLMEHTIWGWVHEENRLCTRWGGWTSLYWKDWFEIVPELVQLKQWTYVFTCIKEKKWVYVVTMCRTAHLSLAKKKITLAYANETCPTLLADASSLFLTLQYYINSIRSWHKGLSHLSGNTLSVYLSNQIESDMLGPNIDKISCNVLFVILTY